MQCPSCGCDNRKGAEFCNECAAPLLLRSRLVEPRIDPNETLSSVRSLLERRTSLDVRYPKRDLIQLSPRILSEDAIAVILDCAAR